MKRLFLISAIFLALSSLMAQRLGPNVANVTSVVTKGGPGILYGVHVYNGNAATRYIQIFDATSLPSNGATPVVAPIPVNTVSTAIVDFGPQGISFINGIVIANSTTATTLTIGSADSSISTSYK